MTDRDRPNAHLKTIQWLGEFGALIEKAKKWGIERLASKTNKTQTEGILVVD